ncbi:hypothetical protein EDC96DRAFT_542497 [Choanephora cucurbitarum]|nr:hypothetical protein EDC96DRAFT_542497 [Choanephora cucurbitarum]
MSGIVILLFTDITLKHCAYDSLSLKSKRATKSMCPIIFRLSDNLIFVYLRVNLLTQDDLEYKPRDHQMMLLWASLRDVVAFILDSGITDQMLQMLEMRTGVVEPEDSGNHSRDHIKEEAVVVSAMLLLQVFCQDHWARLIFGLFRLMRNSRSFFCQMTLAEYWTEKQMKMKRASRNMSNDIHRISDQ